MKNLILIVSLAFLFSCGSENESKEDSNKKKENQTENTTENETTENDNSYSGSSVIADFLNNVHYLETVKAVNPITAFQEVAEAEADEIVEIDNDNIVLMFIKAKDYNHCVVITGDHTIVKVLDFDDCLQSASWDACMPLVEGFIKKGELTYEKDHMNNIIGLPTDEQVRKAYLFK